MTLIDKIYTNLMTPTETTGNRMQWYNVLSSAINSVDPLLDVQML